MWRQVWFSQHDYYSEVKQSWHLHNYMILQVSRAHNHGFKLQHLRNQSWHLSGSMTNMWSCGSWKRQVPNNLHNYSVSIWISYIFNHVQYYLRYTHIPCIYKYLYLIFFVRIHTVLFFHADERSWLECCVATPFECFMAQVRCLLNAFHPIASGCFTSKFAQYEVKQKPTTRDNTTRGWWGVLFCGDLQEYRNDQRQTGAQLRPYDATGLGSKQPSNMAKTSPTHLRGLVNVCQRAVGPWEN